MKIKITIESKGLNKDGIMETYPTDIILPVHDEDGFKVIRFAQDGFNDMLMIARNYGMTILLEE